MALPGGFMDELRTRTPLPGLIGRRHKLERSGRQWKTCCPFHGEKTPSFYVYDDHYHCFGCGAHGDAITFVMQSESTSFMEAVERLARDAGLPMPELSPAVAEAERRRHTLAGVLETAAALFQRRLFSPEGRQALSYLTERGLTQDSIRGFGLGWSGETRGGLAAALSREGVTADLLIQSGLARQDPDTGRTYEVFFNRVMFPIRDRRGSVISFGGRLLGPGEPKYLNGPETTLFAKRQTLYGLDRARTAKTAEIVVVEGYMDVIALHQAGFVGAVAPLGTALTAEQLGELWRISPAPILCFDGDAAGRRAAARAADLALPLLSAERSLCLVPLPDGEDPDSLVRRRGPQALAAVLDAKQPLSDALFEFIRAAVGDKTAEQRAQFRKRLEEAAARIPDRALAGEYRSALLDRFFAARRRKNATPVPAPAARPIPSDQAATAERCRILTAIVILHPNLLPDVADAFRGLDLPADCSRVRHALSLWMEEANSLDSPGALNHLTNSGLAAEAERILAPGFAMPGAMPADAEAGWWEIFRLMHRSRLAEDVANARRDFERASTAESQRRLLALRSALLAAEHGDQDKDA